MSLSFSFSGCRHARLLAILLNLNLDLLLNAFALGLIEGHLMKDVCFYLTGTKSISDLLSLPPFDSPSQLLILFCF